MKPGSGLNGKNAQPRRCKILTCKNAKNFVPKGVGMFLVPKDKDRLEYWVKVTGNPELLEVPLDFVKNNLRLCEDHFRREDVYRGDKAVKKNAKADPLFFPDNHAYLSDEEMDKWRLTKQYGAHYAVDGVKASNVEVSSSSLDPISEVEQPSKVSISGSESSTAVLDTPCQPMESSTPEDTPQQHQQVSDNSKQTNPEIGGIFAEKNGPCNVSKEWEPQIMVSMAGSRIIAIPCWSMEVTGMQ